MRRDFIKKKSAKAGRKWRSIILSTVIGLTVLGLSAVFYKHRIQTIKFVTVSYAEMKAWVTAHRSHVGQQLKAARQIALKEQSPPEIHFEFYTALPKMQINPTDSVKEAKVESTPAPVRAIASTKAPALESKLDAEPLQLAQHSSKPLPFANHEDLVKDFSSHLQPGNYNLQLGLFKSLDWANRFQQSLQLKGFNAKIVKISMSNKNWYRVQYGMFATREEAKFAQQKLQKKGVNGILRKEEM